MLSFVERNQKLKARALVDDRPENERSPSPQPIYDDSGVKINAREARRRKTISIGLDLDRDLVLLLSRHLDRLGMGFSLHDFFKNLLSGSLD